MALIRHFITRTASKQPLRTGVAPAQLSLRNPPRKCFTSGKLDETEPGGQRKLIVAACVTLPFLAYVWHRSGDANTVSGTVGEHRGANQEYKESAEGNR
ncbi:hypothetical protein PENANT_c018G09070 [Penicillium antarcticum]|uniref:Uncharacterized protein n=1 Tax=Penicillium antarcticum TaxID=416450 RepID=A0A1V6Q368_9EURO|nr:uncharacterized protein N7508_003809 [Penicillium antarcticum]KAJ5312979.1 hypothetical protein N7508_003809 [Penicillium antarcticum]OQD83156.1 hypothetical protein PENANT_c018G09070 [Penicillium antarcticum]